MKKLFTIVLAVAIMVSAMATTAFAADNVAEVNGTGYETLQAAVDAAENGAEIDLLGDATGAGVKINKSVTIDFNNYTYTVNKAVGSKGTETLAFQILAGSGATPYDVTLKNGTIAVVNEVTEGKPLKVVIMNYSNLTLDNLVVDGTGSDAMMYGLSTNNGEAEITGNTSILVNDGVTGIDVDGSQKSYGDASITIDTTGKIEGEVAVYGDEASAVVENGSFDADVKDYIADGKNLVKVDGEYVIDADVAAISDVKYASLQAAVDAAESGAEIDLLGDATGAGVKINKSVTIDFNNYTYTVNKAVGSKGTETLAFQILADASKNPYDVTLKNGTIAVVNNVTSGKDLKVVIMNYSNLTLENLVVDGTGSDAMMYGLSTNNGEASITGNTSILVNDGVTGLDVDGSQKSYGAASIKIDTTGKIEGDVAVYGDEASAVVENGTFDADVRDYVADGKNLVDNGDGTFGVAPASEWTTDTDAGYYLNDANEKLGLMRFLFGIDTNETVKNFGIKYIKAANIGEDVNGENATGNEVSGTGDFKVFYGDIVNIPETYTEGTYYAAGFVELESGEFKWSDIIECSLNWTRFFKDYKVGGAN